MPHLRTAPADPEIPRGDCAVCDARLEPGRRHQRDSRRRRKAEALGLPEQIDLDRQQTIGLVAAVRTLDAARDRLQVLDQLIRADPSDTNSRRYAAHLYDAALGMANAYDAALGMADAYDEALRLLGPALPHAVFAPSIPGGRPTVSRAARAAGRPHQVLRGERMTGGPSREPGPAEATVTWGVLDQ